MTTDEYQQFLESNSHMLVAAAKVIARAKSEAKAEGLSYEGLLLFTVTHALHQTDDASAYMRYLSNLWSQAQA
jgi:hypothetical protein